MSTQHLVAARRGFAAQVAENIRVQAAIRGLNQSDVARGIGVSPRTVNERWWGSRQWQLEDIERVSRLLGVTPALLCAARDSNPEPASWFLRLVRRLTGRRIGADRAVLAPVVDLVSRERVA